MTDKLEKYFFDTFGIEPSTKYDYCLKSEENKDKLYPQITDHILLELICISLQQYCNYSGNINIKNIKKKTLRVLLRHKNYLKEIYTHSGSYNSFVKKVRAVFKEGD